jgi:hypothetical protein
MQLAFWEDGVGMVRKWGVGRSSRDVGLFIALHLNGKSDGCTTLIFTNSVCVTNDMKGWSWNGMELGWGRRGVAEIYAFSMHSENVNVKPRFEYTDFH